MGIFDMFDFNGDGNVSNSEKSFGLAMLMEILDDDDIDDDEKDDNEFGFDKDDF